MRSHSHHFQSCPSGFYRGQRFRALSLCLQQPAPGSAPDLPRDPSSKQREHNAHPTLTSQICMVPVVAISRRSVALESLGGQEWPPLSCSGLGSSTWNEFGAVSLPVPSQTLVSTDGLLERWLAWENRLNHIWGVSGAGEQLRGKF